MDSHDAALLCKMLLLALSLIAFCYQIMALVFQPL